MDKMKPNFKFTVLGADFLKPTELQALTFLYQPLIGIDAFSLYHLLAGLPNGTTKKHHLLLQITGGNLDNLIASRHRLEASGLLEVFATDDCLTYIVKSPLTVKQFFGEAIMRAFLYVQIGAQDFNAIKSMLLPNSHTSSESGVRVTKRFDEIFDIRSLTHAPTDLRFTAVAPHQELGIDVASMFDVSSLQQILIQKGISANIITLALLKLLNEFAFLYKFDVHELARLVFDATMPDGTVDIIRMKQLARTQFQLLNKGTHLAVVTNQQLLQDDVTPVGGSEREKILLFLEQSPVEFLRFKAGGKPPVSADLRIVEWLHLDQGMPAGVVNVLVDYVLDYADGKLPKALVETIVGQWQRLEINTTAQAMEQVATVLQKSNDYQKEKVKPATPKVNVKRATRVEPIPAWIADNHANAKLSAADEANAKARIEQMKQTLLQQEKGVID